MPQFLRRGREWIRLGVESGIGPTTGIVRAPMVQGFRNLRSPGIVRPTWPLIAQPRVVVGSSWFTARNFVVTGITKNDAGAPTGGMVVHLFRWVAVPEYISQGVSDGAGAYSLPTPNNAGPFFVVSFHADGSLAGVTRPVLTATAV